MSEIILSSSILSADFGRLKDQVREAETSGVDWIHIDVMDGHFVPNLTMGPFIVETVRGMTDLPLDVHLMVDNPDVMIPWFVSAGADWISVQIETCPHIFRTLQTISALGKHPGVVLNPGTPPAVLDEVLHLTELVLVMSVNPGASGQSFIPSSIRKVSQIHHKIQGVGSQARIQVDGGVTSANIADLKQAGAEIFVAATAIFRHPQGIAAGVRALRTAAA